MRIAVDAHMVGEREGGNETYIRGLLTGLSQAGRKVIGLVASKGTREGRLPGGHWYRTLGSMGNLARLTYGLPRACAGEHLDLAHLTYHAPFYMPCPFVLSVHDISFRTWPALFSPRDRLLLNAWLPWSARRARLILTGSEATRCDLEEKYPYLKGKIRVTPYAAGDEYRPVSAEARALVCVKYGIRPPFVLAVGRLDPRKNLGRVIEAWRAARLQLDCRLVLAGGLSYQGDKLLESIQAERAGGEIVVTGYVAADDMPSLYSAAAVFAYPSLFEGFGLPVVEAMRCGTPVITSNRSSLPEVAGEAALMVDPLKTSELERAMVRLLSDEALAHEFGEKGKARADQFTWQRTAAETWQVYQEASGKV